MDSLEEIITKTPEQLSSRLAYLREKRTQVNNEIFIMTAVLNMKKRKDKNAKRTSKKK